MKASTHQGTHAPTGPLLMLPQPAGDPSMELTLEERQCALAIKHAIESSQQHINIKPMPDFEYAYLAIACREKTLPQILDVAYKMQGFWAVYSLDGTPQQGISLIWDMLELMPGLVLDISFLPSEQCFSISAVQACLRPDFVKTEAQWRIFQGGSYYALRSATTDFRSIRNGISIMAECEGMGFHNFDFSFFERNMTELWSWFPYVVKEEFWFNAPAAAKMVHVMAKRIVSKERIEKWTLLRGVEGYDGSINDLFQIPTPEIAQQHLLQRIERYLWQRHHNQQTFSLTT